MVPRECLNQKLKDHRTVPLRARREAVSGRSYLWGTVEHSWLFEVSGKRKRVLEKTMKSRSDSI